MKVVLFFSTGRCGTHFLSHSIKKKEAYICHEEEHPSAKAMMDNFYVPHAMNYDYENGEDIVNLYKIPFIASKLTEGIDTFIDTGHQYNYGLWPHLINNIPDIKIIRLRRDRIDTARSFLTTPESEDIWNKKTFSGKYRWMMHPKFEICDTTKIILDQWANMSREQRVLWAIDEVERQWEKLKVAYDFEYIDLEFKQLIQNDLNHLERFLQCKIIPKQDENSKNSSKYKNRSLKNININTIKEEDKKLQKLYNNHI